MIEGVPLGFAPGSATLFLIGSSENRRSVCEGCHFFEKAGISSVSALRRTTEVVDRREGGDPSGSRKSPGETKYAPITLERGVTHDTEFEDWAGLVWKLHAGLGSEVGLKNFRKDITLELYNEPGQVAKAFRIYRC